MSLLEMELVQRSEAVVASAGVFFGLLERVYI